MINYSIANKNIALLTFDMPGSTNVINEASIQAFADAFEKALQDDTIKGIVITSAKKDFVVGADLNMLLAVKSEQDCLEKSAELDALFRKIEQAPKPVVAAINGTALGGGLELCLATHYRIAIDQRAQLGLPEVTLGLLPGGGGTQRLPRMIGAEAAAPLLMEGKKVDPKKARTLGIIEELVADRDTLLERAYAWIGQATAEDLVKPWDKKGFKVPGGDPKHPKVAQLFMAAGAMLVQKTYGNYPAPRAILDCVYQGLQLPFDQGVALESKYFARLVMSKEAKNMIRTLFFGIGAANKGVARPEGIPPQKINKVGILGAGMMGAGIAYVTAKNGMDVVLKDVSEEAAAKGKAYSAQLLDKKKQRGYIDETQYNAVIDKIHPTDTPDALSGSDLVIEAVFENRDLKARVTQEAEAQLDAEAIFASNTSTLPISGLAQASERPDNFIGLHFFSPVDKMPLVEVIMGEKTTEATLARSLDYVKAIKKTPIVVNDSRGFYTSRVFATYLYEGFNCLSEGIHPVLIENAGKQCGMPVGPLALADEVAIDLMYKILKQTEADTGMTRDDHVKSVVTRFVEELDRPGKKARKGFYDYPDKGKKHIWSGLADIFPVADTQPEATVLGQRFLFAQALEAVKCLDEKVVRSPTDADVGSILGWGFPPYTGGAISYIDYIGIDHFVRQCEAFAEQYGPRFQPPLSLIDRAKTGQTFFSDKPLTAAHA